MPMNEQTARRLHQDSLVIDAHNDSIVALIRRGMSLDGAQRADFHQREGGRRLFAPVTSRRAPAFSSTCPRRARAG